MVKEYFPDSVLIRYSVGCFSFNECRHHIVVVMIPYVCVIRHLVNNGCVLLMQESIGTCVAFDEAFVLLEGW